METQGLGLDDLLSSVKVEGGIFTPQESADTMIPNSNLQQILEDEADPYEVQMQDFEEVQKQAINDFNQNAWTTGTGYEAPNFPMWSEKMEGLENGFYIFAGFANAGKTAVAMNIAADYAMCEKNHLHLLYFSLDDSLQRVIPRFISMNQSIPIAVAARPQRFQDKINRGEEGSSRFVELLRKREEGLELLKQQASNMLIQGADTAQCLEKMLNIAKMYKTYVRTKDDKANIIVVVDSMMDIVVDSVNTRDEKEKNTIISQTMKRWADEELQCPVFGTAHLRKNTSTKRPVISDLKETGRYEYDATAIFLVANDVSRNGQNADIYYHAPDDPSGEKLPILEIQWAKNKASDFKERTYCFFTPSFSKATECPKELAARFDEKIYSL